MMSSRCILLVALCIMICLCISCVKKNSIPSKEDVQAFFDDNYDTIMIINNYIMNSDHQYVVINNFSGVFYANINHQRDSSLPDSIITALNKLADNQEINIVYLSDNMTIEYEIWYDNYDRGCGFAYVLDDRSIPCIQYLLSYEKLSTEGWYYYFTDYNATR